MLTEVSIEILRKCPNRCLHCSSLADIRCKEKMPLDKFKEVVLDAAKLGAKTICLSGGEPFLHDQVTQMVKFVKNCRLNCYVYTSGICLDEVGQVISLKKETLRDISDSVTKLIFNVEAGTENVYDKVMGTKGCFEKMKQSVSRATTAGITVEAHFVPMAINIGEIDAVLALCETLHMSKLSILRLVLHGRALQNKGNLELTPEQIAELKKRLQTIQDRSDIAIRVGVPLSLDVSCHKCEAARGKLNIKYDGEVFPCEVFKNCSMGKSLGGLKPDSIYQRSLADIYENSEFLRCVRKLSKEFEAAGTSETCIGQHLIELEEEEK